MRARLGEWIEAATKAPTDAFDHMWSAGGMYALRGLVMFRTAHLDESVLMDIAAEVALNLRTREASADIARSAAA